MKKFTVFLLILLILSSCSTLKREKEDMERSYKIIGMKNYFLEYPDDWAKVDTESYVYAYSFDDDIYLYVNELEDDLDSALDIVIRDLSKSRNDVFLDESKIEIDERDDPYFSGVLNNEDGKIKLVGYFKDNLLLIYFGDKDKTKDFFNHSIESIEEI